MWTKRQLVSKAHGEIALAGYEFDITAEEQNDALERLDAMLGTWEGKQIRLGYRFPATPEDSDLDDVSGLPDMANEAVYLNLAIRLAPSFGKQLSNSTLAAAKDAYDTLLVTAAFPTQQQMPNTMPRGAGNKPWRTANTPFFPRPDTNPLQVTEGGDLRVLPE